MLGQLLSAAPRTRGYGGGYNGVDVRSSQLAINAKPGALYLRYRRICGLASTDIRVAVR